MGLLKKDVNNLWEEQLNQVFSQSKRSDMDEFLKILSIIIADEYPSSVIGSLYKNLGFEKFTDLINEFSGLQIEIPKREAFRDAILLALAYYYKHEKRMSWKDIKKEINFDDFAPLRTGRKLLKLDRTIKAQILNILSDEKGFEEDEEFVEEVLGNER